MVKRAEGVRGLSVEVVKGALARSAGAGVGGARLKALVHVGLPPGGELAAVERDRGGVRGDDREHAWAEGDGRA